MLQYHYHHVDLLRAYRNQLDREVVDFAEVERQIKEEAHKLKLEIDEQCSKLLDELAERRDDAMRKREGSGMSCAKLSKASVIADELVITGSEGDLLTQSQPVVSYAKKFLQHTDGDDILTDEVDKDSLAVQRFEFRPRDAFRSFRCKRANPQGSIKEGMSRENFA